VAKINQVKLKQDADAAEKSGRFDKAIDALRQIVQENPRDWTTVNRIGDLYAKLNNTKAANEQYVKVARFLADDGFHLKAIALWKKVLRNDSSMLDGYMSLGDLYARQGLPAEAKQTFGFVYDEYVKRNKLREAGEVLRRMADVDPSDMKVRIRLAELYVREGAVDKAAGEYGGIADEFVKKGLLAEALQLLEKALRSVPNSARLLTSAARVHLVQKDYARAAGLLELARKAAPADRDIALRLAEACLGAKRGEEARRVLEELLKRDATDIEARQQLGQVFLAGGRFDEAFDQLLPAVDKLVERRQADRAAALLQQVVQKNPSHIRSLAKLVELYRQSRNDALVAQTYSQMVEAYLAEGALEPAASILDMLVQLEPHNEQHRTKLRWVREQQGRAGFEVDLQQPAPTASPAALPPPSAPAAEPPPVELSGPLSAEDQEFIGEHLAEGRVFRKYGLGDKARDHFEAVLNRFPDSVEALQEIIDIHREKGESEAAARRLRILAQVLRLKGDKAKAAGVEDEADRLMPPPVAAGPPPSPAVAPAAAPVPTPPSAVAPPRAAPPRAAPPPFAPPPSAAIPLPPPPAPALAPPPPVAVAAPAVQARSAAEEIDISIEEAHEEAEAAVEDYIDLEPEPPPAEQEIAPFDRDLDRGGEIGAAFIDEDEEPETDIPFDLEEPESAPPPVPAPVAVAPPVPPIVTTELRVPAAPAAAAPAAGLPAELGRGLDEVESYVSMGFVDDAKGIVQDLVGRFGPHAALVDRVAALGLEMPGRPAEGGAAFDELVPGEGQEEDELLEIAPPDEPDEIPPPAPSPAAVAADEPLSLGADFLDFDGAAAAAPPAPPLATEMEPPAEDLADATVPPTEGFDLESELGGLFSAQPAVAEEAPAPAGTDFGDAALADIFREFQKGVDKQLGKEDYETRYNLGIAYKEMGLVDEAIAEFQLAAKDESRLLECSSMLGICFLEKGMPKLAVKWFEKGLQAPGRTEDEYQALRYDLANALEQSGEVERARAIFTELYGQDSTFRDVAERVRQLGVSR
jgi:tetratricopeptide (TPR) repeat protein